MQPRMSVPPAVAKILILLVAAALSAAAGFGAVYAIFEWLPRIDDAAGHGLASVYTLFAMALYVLVTAVVFGIAAFRADPATRLRRGLWALLIAPLFILIFGMTDTGLNVNLKKELVGAAQLFVPLWVVAAVQWVVWRWYMGRTTRADT